MNICLISREYPPFHGGGIGSYTVRFARALAGTGHRPVVVTVSEDGREGRERDGDVEVVRLPFIKGMAQWGDWSGPHPAIATPETSAAFNTFSPVAVFAMQIAAALPRLVREFELEVVETPDTGALAWFALNARRTGTLWRDENRPAFVTCVHSPTEWIAEWNRTVLGGRRDAELVGMERDCAAWTDAIVTPSATMAEWIASGWGMRQGNGAEVIPYPLGELEVVARSNAEGHRPPHHPPIDGPGRVLFAGRLEPRKGIETLLAGFSRALADGTDLSIDLAGEDMPEAGGGDAHGARLIAALSSEERARIRAHGRVDAARLAELRRAAAVIVVPSPMDNFPNTCMEAMAEGKVVVAARAGGMAEMIRDDVDGLLFAPGDAAACGTALSRAVRLEPGTATEMRRSAARRMLDMCGNQAVVGRRIDHYRRVIQRRDSGRDGPVALRDGDFVVIHRGSADRAQVARLIAAARHAGADFAHGWTRDDQGRARAFSTPRPETLCLAPRQIGPLVVSRICATEALSGAPSWESAMRLLEAGCRGVVVPEVIVDDRARGGVVRRMVRALRGNA